MAKNKIHATLYMYAEMPTSPILSYFVRQTEQNTIILFCLSKYDFPQCLSSALSLFSSFLFLYQTITLVWHFISLLSSGGNPTKIKSWRSILHYLPRSHFCCICSLYCTVLHALCSLWLYPVYIPYLFGSSPHRTAKQLFVPIYSILC